MENKEQALEQLKAALAAASDDTTEVNFASAEDESSFFPAEIDGWKIIRRQSQLVPKHYANHATYQRVAVKKVEANEEAQPSNAS